MSTAETGIPTPETQLTTEELRKNVLEAHLRLTELKSKGELLNTELDLHRLGQLDFRSETKPLEGSRALLFKVLTSTTMFVARKEHKWDKEKIMGLINEGYEYERMKTDLKERTGETPSQLMEKQNP